VNIRTGEVYYRGQTIEVNYGGSDLIGSNPTFIREDGSHNIIGFRYSKSTDGSKKYGTYCLYTRLGLYGKDDA